MRSAAAGRIPCSHLFPRHLPYANTRRAAYRTDVDSRATTQKRLSSAHRAHLTHPHRNQITQTIPSTDHLSHSSSQTSSAKLKHRGVDPHQTPCTALREFINTKARATATSTLHQEQQNPNISDKKHRQHMPDRSRDRHRIIHQKDRHPDIQKPHTRH